MALAPALAPMVGAGLLLGFGWESIFLLLTLYATAMLALLLWWLPEPMPPERRQSIAPGSLLANFRMLLTQREFIGHTLANASAFTGMFAFLSGSSFVLIEFMGVSSALYGALFTAIVGGFFTGSLLSGRYSRRLGHLALIGYGSGLCALEGISMATLALLGVYSPWAVILPHVVYMIGFGIVMPQSMAGALAPNPQCAGSASSLFGFLQMGLAAVGSALAIGLGGGLALLVHVGLLRPTATGGNPMPARR